jgi:hypothetical protein
VIQAFKRRTISAQVVLKRDDQQLLKDIVRCTFAFVLLIEGSSSAFLWRGSEC